MRRVYRAADARGLRRCKAVTTLRDKSQADCMRQGYSQCEGYCLQHYRMAVARGEIVKKESTGPLDIRGAFTAEEG
jgi:hypothetical protein